MGVKLQKIIIRKKLDLSKLAGKVVAIDAPNVIFSLFNFSYKNRVGFKSELMTDRTQRKISHLYGLLYRINFYYSKKIFPIFCFDGRDSELKRIVTKDQLNDFRFTQKRYKEAIKIGNKYLARSIALSKEFLWPNLILESKQLLSALGVPYIESPASAESQCAYLVKNKIASYSNSQDFDSLLFGCPLLIQNLSKSLRRKVQGKWTYKKIEPLIINLKENLKILQIDQFQLVDSGILIGTDYFPGIKGIGPKKALTLVKKLRNLENIIESEKYNYDFSELTPKIIRKVRKIILFPEVLEFIDDIFWNPPDKGAAINLACRDHHLSEERFKNNLNKLNDNYYKCKTFFKTNINTKSAVQKTLDFNF
ncbi:MAG: hypothetical protein ACTSRI_20365 [Promethearchaeota archaeon]